MPRQLVREMRFAITGMKIPSSNIQVPKKHE